MRALIAALPLWAAEKLATLPRRWADRLESEWRRFAGVDQQHAQGLEWKHAGADAWLSRRLEELEAGQRAGITPAMDDAALCKLAEAEAREARHDRAGAPQLAHRHAPGAGGAVPRGARTPRAPRGSAACLARTA